MRLDLEPKLNHLIECCDCNFSADIVNIADDYMLTYCPACGDETLEHYTQEISDDPL